MTNIESNRLMAYHYAQINRPTMSVRVTSRRTAKSKATATGQILKSSKIIPGVWIEKVWAKQIR